MFWHDTYGLVTNMTQRQYNKLQGGECICAIPYKVCLDAAWHMEEGKPYSTFPQRALTRAEAAEILTHYKRGLL